MSEQMTPFEYGYDDFLNGGDLDYAPLNTPADNEYRQGWRKAQLDSLLSGIKGHAERGTRRPNHSAFHFERILKMIDDYEGGSNK